MTLRDADGKIQRILSYASGSGNAAVYTGIMQEEESAQGVVSANPTPYYVYVNGKDVHQTLWRVPKTNKPSGCTHEIPYETTVTYYTASVTVKKDNAAWTNAALTLDNGREHYALTHTTGGVYTADVLDGDAYALTVENVTDTISKSAASTMLDYYTVSYYTYQKASDGKSYTQVSTPARSQIVRKGVKTSAPSDVYVEGLTFRWYSATQWNNGDAYAQFDYNTTITAAKSLYAQFAKPDVKVNEFLRTDASGAVNGSGAYFRLGNLTISGYDPGSKAILSAQISTKNVTSIKLVNASGYTVSTLGGTLSNNATTSDSVLSVKFGSGVSMAAAQAWLRENLVFTPKAGATCEVEVSVSDRDISTATTTSNAQSQVGEALTKLTGSNNDLASGAYYVESNVSYTGPTDTSKTAAERGGLRIQDGATVYIYVKSGATLTAKGADASGTTGGGAGIYVPTNATLYLAGEGSVIATGGNGGDGGGGAGAGIGGYGGAGGNGADAAGPIYPSGTGGAQGNSGTYNADKNITTNDYTVTFTGASSATKNYSFCLNTTISTPDYTGGGADKIFLGWQVTKYGKNFVNSSAPLTSAEKILYQPGQSITLAAGTVGNITLTPILRDKVGILWRVPKRG